MADLWCLSPSDQSRNIGVDGYGFEMGQMNRLPDAACLLEVDFHGSPVGPEAPQEPAPLPRGLYRVQAGAFAQKANAEAQAARLKAAGYDAFLRESAGLYRVQAGAFASRANAEAQAERLKKDGFDAFVSG